MTHPRAGQPAQPDDLVDISRLVTAYFTTRPDPSVAEQRVTFGTSGHRGSSLLRAFNEDHILAVSQAVVDYRTAQGITGPLFLVRDTHALSEPAFASAIEVFAANEVTVLVDSRDGYTPTPVLSHAVIAYNRNHSGPRADGVVLTPSHNPPTDGGYKYNPPHGGPADADATGWIQDRANALLEAGLDGVRRVPYSRARAADTMGTYDYLDTYVADLPGVVDLHAIASSGLHIGADPLGGASVAYWAEIATRYGLDLTVTNPLVDPTWRFMMLDWDGKIRMDPSSPYVMEPVTARRASYDIGTGNDADSDRHGIVTSAGLMNPNHYLAVSIGYLFAHRPDWPAGAAVGKTLVSSSMIDRVAADVGRRLVEVPVGFKWFVPGLISGEIGFGGEESAGASFLRRDGSTWTTDKDGIIAALLASEMTAVTGQTPSDSYQGLTRRFGDPAYARVDAPATRAQKSALAKLTAEQVSATELAGEPITAKLTSAPGNGAALGGLKVSTKSGWFAARPSGTEDVYKIYAESFQGPDHLARIQEEARAVVSAALTG